MESLIYVICMGLDRHMYISLRGCIYMPIFGVNRVATVYHESFEAKNLCGQCITQIFTKKLSRIPIVIAISTRFSIATEIFLWKKVLRNTKKPRKPRNFSDSKLSWYTVFTSQPSLPMPLLICHNYDSYLHLVQLQVCSYESSQ